LIERYRFSYVYEDPEEHSSAGGICNADLKEAIEEARQEFDGDERGLKLIRIYRQFTSTERLKCTRPSMLCAAIFSAASARAS